MKSAFLRLGPGYTTEILDFLIQACQFDPMRLHAIDRLLKITPDNAQVTAGRYKRGEIEDVNNVWPVGHFGLIYGFHVLGNSRIQPTPVLG